MGLTQSTVQAEQPKAAENIETETKTTTNLEEPVASTNALPEPVAVESTKTVEPVTEEKKVESVSNSVPETDNPSEVFERYIEKPGTKVEVAPVEVAPSDDVVKKTKRKNKNKNKEKQNEKH